MEFQPEILRLANSPVTSPPDISGYKYRSDSPIINIYLTQVTMLNNLSNDILYLVASFLKVPEINNLAATCQDLKLLQVRISTDELHK